MQNLSNILPLFCAPTWPSHHMSENQESINHCHERLIPNTLIYAVIIEKRADHGVLLTLNWPKTELPEL